jgi:hypothetical protein
VQNCRKNRFKYWRGQLISACLIIFSPPLFSQYYKLDRMNFEFLRDCSVELRWDETQKTIVDIRTTSSGDIFGQSVFIHLPNIPLDIEEGLVRLKGKGKYLSLNYSQILLPKKVGGAPGIVVYGLKLDVPLASVRKTLSNAWGGHFLKVTKDGVTYFEFQENYPSAQKKLLITNPRISVDNEDSSKTYVICDYSF